MRLSPWMNQRFSLVKMSNRAFSSTWFFVEYDRLLTDDEILVAPGAPW